RCPEFTEGCCAEKRGQQEDRQQEGENSDEKAKNERAIIIAEHDLRVVADQIKHSEVSLKAAQI
ncbi:MAG: hypothetical protein COY47_04670, partial [Chloroflexi bacterium CG_4_10_14_0_8_um_filter_57_5]